MKRGALATLAVVGIIFTSQSNASAQQPSATYVQATTDRDVLVWDRYITQRERSGQLRLRSEVRDPALPARTLERFDQYHQGVRIWGADIVRDSERGVAVSVFGVLAPDLTLSVEPSLGVEAARQRLLGLAATNAALLTDPELVVLPLDTGEHRLAYTAVVSGAGEVVRAFIDAHTGAELLRYSEIQTQAAVGTGRGVLGDTKKVSVLQQSGVYLTDDRLRPPVLTTYDMRGNLAKAIAVLNGGSLFPSDLAGDTDNIWTDSAVVDAHVHVGWTYDYYFKRFGRRGLDDSDRSIVIMTNAVTQQGALALRPSDFGLLAVNAFWCNTCGPDRVGVMYFGNGIPPGYYLTSSGRNYTYFAGALDIVAHELTHGVTSSTSELINRNESGALNEAFSDMMGKSVEFFYHSPGSGVGQADYVLGKDIARAVRAGALNGSRSMANPGLYGDPDHYSKRYLGTADQGGVHSNSGIANHVFYLAIEGGTNRTSGLSVQGVGGANREQIEKVFYRAFTLLMPASATFAMARAATVQAAGDLYGASGNVVQAVTQAWNAVGVPDPRSIGTFAGSVSSFGYTWYTITMNATGRYQATLTWSDPSINLDLYLSPIGCNYYSCLLTRSTGVGRNSETISWPVRSGEQYRLWIDNFTYRWTSFTVEHFISSLSSLVVPQTPADSGAPVVGQIERSVAKAKMEEVNP